MAQPTAATVAIPHQTPAEEIQVRIIQNQEKLERNRRRANSYRTQISDAGEQLRIANANLLEAMLSLAEADEDRDRIFKEMIALILQLIHGPKEICNSNRTI